MSTHSASCSDSDSTDQRRRGLLKASGLAALAGAASATLTACGATDTQPGPASAASAIGGNLSRRKLGQLDVSALGFGAMNVVHAYGPPVDRTHARKVIRHAYDKGARFFDTAEIYGPFASEELVGEALQSVRNDLAICTKFGFNITPQGEVRGLSSHPDTIRRVCEQSLRRLKTDRIDLLYQHRIDPTIPIEDVAGAVQNLIKEGKVLHFGLSGAGAATIRRAHAVQPVTAVQNHYAFWSRQPEVEVLPVCEELGIGFVPWSPLGMGYLTGTVAAETEYFPDDLRDVAKFPRFTVEARRVNWPVVNLLQRVGRPKGATPGQVALAWLLAQKPFIVPIPGTTKMAHLDENMGALDLVLDAQDLKTLADGFSAIKVQGVFSGEQQMAAMDLGEREGSSSAGGHGLSPLPVPR